ncbi:MAG: tRNA pseudouridine(55) synthase TruB [Gemmatimonadota bacterium]|nr:MAG: tRNA pseudouridine(55) synthase TruB [Gemmatimonadota bacterium]
MSVPAAGGLLPVDKPVGPTSHDVVAWCRRALSTRKIGHTGTLDPFASGLLLLCIGRATRLAEYITALDKTYEAIVHLGVSTDTHDRQGAVVAESDLWRSVTEAQVEAALSDLRGPIAQIPPQFSAKKVDGESMHRRARRGEYVDLPPVNVTVHELTLASFDPPELGLTVTCSSGTYVRALARDLGEALGAGAHLTELRRTCVGGFGDDRALPGGELQGAVPLERVEQFWISPTEALAHLDAVDVSAADARQLAMGQWLETAAMVPEGVPIAVREGGRLIAVAVLQDGRLRPRKVLEDA